MKDNNRKKQGFPWFALLIFVIGVVSQATDEGAIALVVFLPILLVAAVVYVLRKKAGTSGGAASPRAADRRPDKQPGTPPRRPVAERRAFPEPDAHCVVCENTGEDHFARDREKRIRQLDDWLKNGLIDRAEYQVLKRRYEQDL